jgi:hypothetical protein
MTKLNKFLAFIILLLNFPSVNGQDLFNESNSYKFANYLFKTQQFNLAAQEFERLVFLSPENNNYKLSLIQSYRYSGEYINAQKRLLLFYGDSLYTINQSVGIEYIKLTILKDSLVQTETFLERNSKLEVKNKLHFQTCLFLLENKWEKADSLITKNTGIDPILINLTNKAIHAKYKSPFLATSFSFVLPGLGKAYCGYWKDGIISLIFIGANAWQTYRGFTKYGPKNAHGWIFGGLTAGFYFGNLYGSWKAAKKHNKKINDKIFNETRNYILSSF